MPGHPAGARPARAAIDPRALVDAGVEPAWLVDPQGRVVHENRPAQELLGGLAVGRSLEEIGGAALAAAWRQAIAAGSATAAVSLAGHRPIPVTARLTRFSWGDEPAAYCGLIDRRREVELEDRLRAQEARLDLLNAFALAINATSDIQQFFASALESLRSIVSFDTASIVRILPETDEVEFLAAVGRDRPPGCDPGDRAPFPVRQTLPLLLSQGYLLRDYTGPSEIERRFHERGWRSGISMPLVVQDEILGVLNLGSRTPSFYGSEVARELRAPAAQLAAALKKLIVLDESEQRRRKVEKLASQIARLNAELEERVAARTLELQRAYDELRDLDRAKTVFLSTVSHELKTPLVTVTGYLEMALRRQLGPTTARQERAFETALRNTRRLDRLIDDLLDLTRLELGKERIQPSRFELARVVDDAVGAVAVLAEAKAIRIERSLPGDLPWVRGDPHRIGQVLTNLLSNAVKFSEPGRSVWIEARSDGNGVEIGVRDEGVGIPREHHERVFESFYQVDGGPTRHFGGAGLGLAIARSILHAHGTRIRLDSEPGRGSRFSFTLPAVEPERTGSSPPPPRRARPAPRPGTRVLVVEDEDEIQEFVKIVLEMEGYEVVQARSGREALQAAEERRPDVVLLDIAMAGLSGIEVCRTLKARETTRGVPVYMLSARTGEEDRGASAAAGADGFIRKPFTPDELLDVLAASRSGAGGAQ